MNANCLSHHFGSSLREVAVALVCCVGFWLGASGEPAGASSEFPFSYTLTDVSGRTLEVRVDGVSEEAIEVERIADRKVFTIPLSTLSEKDRSFFREKARELVLLEASASGSLLVPGETLLLDFPELESMAGGKPAQCEISVPSSYDPGRPVPLLVWFSGGSGSHQTRSADGVVDFDRYIVVALPYPGGRLPRLAVEEGEDAIDAFWDFQRPMLEKVIEQVPNISEEVRIAGGTSSGAHLLGSALDRKWRGFCDYFTGFVLHEGGTCPDMEFRGARSSHRILVAYGEVSTARQWQDYFMERFEQARGRHTFAEIAGAGHGLNGAGKMQIRQWIDETFGTDLP